MPSLPEPQRLFGAVLSLIHAGSGGALTSNGGSLDLGLQDAHGCTLMHYVCALRNMPALQLLIQEHHAGWQRLLALQRYEILGSQGTPEHWQFQQMQLQQQSVDASLDHLLPTFLSAYPQEIGRAHV